MSLKWLKYAYKRQALSLAPHLYWSLHRRLCGPLEPELLLLPYLCRPNAATVDIGANWGAYSQAAMALSQSVHSFEPQPRLARVLRRGLGRSPKLTVYGVALSNANGQATFRVPRNDIGYSTIEPSNRLDDKVDMSRGIDSVSVETRRLDAMDIGPVGFIKIDVEGHEQEVLEGASATLERDQPSLLIEVEERHRAGAVAGVVGLLSSLGYQAFVHTALVLEKFDLPAVGEPASTGRNLVFVHGQQLSSLSPSLFGAGVPG